jgi:hypothetical protein
MYNNTVQAPINPQQQQNQQGKSISTGNQISLQGNSKGTPGQQNNVRK